MPPSIPAVPLTIEGAAILHQMFRVKRSAWRRLEEQARQAYSREAALALGDGACSAAYALLGHKADLMLVHFRRTFADLAQAQMAVSQLQLAEFLEPASSFVSVVELSLYESTVKTYESLAEQGIEPHSEAWNQKLEEVLERQRQAMAPRLFPEIPPHPYICFYPMDRKRGERHNWYTVPLGERQRMMHEHGLVGRRYAGQVRQIISGSIGYDDWEWGVDLFADDPLQFKRLIYEMRFDEASALYALFGPFYLGLRVDAQDLQAFLDGKLKPVGGGQ